MDMLDYLADYREIDPCMELVIAPDAISNFIKKSTFSKKTKIILNELYENLAPLNESAFFLLHKYPPKRGTIDLTLFEGSGFYQYHEPYWIYHKGGGCIEALTIKERFELNPIYAAFGAEYSGYLGTFSSITLLGVKRLWQCVHEFASAFTLLGHAIEHNDAIRCYQEVIGQITIPLCVVSLPNLSLVIQKNLHTKPESIIKSYNDASSENQAAKILMLVPSPIRGTDNYAIEGKWFETDNIFNRTASLYKTQLNKFDKSPFWDKEQTKIRARTIRSMFNAGFVFQPISAHLQNYYVIPNPIEGGIAFSAADFCDFLPSKHFNLKDLECVLQNILNGWRIAESSGPMYTSYNSAISLKEIHDLADLFFEELLGENHHNDIGRLYLLLPFSSCVSIIKIFSNRQPKNLSILTWERVLASIKHGKTVQEKMTTISNRYKKELEVLFKPLESLRPSALITEITNHLSGIESKNTKLIVSLFNKIMSLPEADMDKKPILYYVGYAVEICFFLGKNSQKAINNIASNLTSLSKIEALTISFLEEYVSILRGKSLMQFLKDHLEEIIHIKHHDLRKWIVNVEEPNHIKDWIFTFAMLTKNFIKDPPSLLKDYLGFTFKKENILEIIKNSNIKSTIKSKLSGPWDGRERPVYRPYPVVEFKDSISDEEAIRFFIPLSRFLHRIGFIL